MDCSEAPKPRRFQPGEVIISEVTKDDLQLIAEGYYASFPTTWFDKIEPKHLRPEDDALRARRFAIRMAPWISEPNTRWVKALLHPSSPDYDPSVPDRIIGHAGWLLPERTKSEIMNFWRRDASDALGWREKMGWTKEYEDELWSGTDLDAYDVKGFVAWDRMRDRYVGGKGHWHLAPIWVLPEYQHRGVASLLLLDGTNLADQEDPVPPMYLEAMAEAVPVYKRFGYQMVEGEGAGWVMIRTLPENAKAKA